MSTHTPGPWTAVQDGNKVDWYLVDEDENVIVFGLSEPDARLSAAAPDLLALAQEALDVAIVHKLPLFEGRARTAIAKAEGTQNEDREALDDVARYEEREAEGTS